MKKADMKLTEIKDIRIKGYSNTSSPEWLWEILPISAKAYNTVVKTRKVIEAIINGSDTRRLFIIGSCSVHNINETKEYTRQLRSIVKKVEDKILIIERVSVEKPRTFADWPGILEDPFMDGSNDIETGRYLARQLLLEINEMTIPCATEYVNTSTPQYIGDLVSWSWVGARTVESQMHKRMASGLSTSVGFKNSLQGNIDSAINAVITAATPNKFSGIKPNGKEATINSTGNPYGVVILRGGDRPNYYQDDVKMVQNKLKSKKLRPILIIDCSHGNSQKDHKKQTEVFKNVIEQMKSNKGIIGLMLESYIKEGKQKKAYSKKSKYGVSITDACISLPDTMKLIDFAYKRL